MIEMSKVAGRKATKRPDVGSQLFRFKTPFDKTVKNDLTWE
jgi:hypothetical protein